MKTWRTLLQIAAAFVAVMWLSGCKLLKPTAGNPRTFELTPVSTTPALTPTGPTKIVVGIRPVKMAGYLSTKSIAMRKGANEIFYLDTLVWSERLDGAFQRVFAADLGTLIPTDQVRLNLWEPEAITVELEVSVDQFDVDSRGQGVLTAWWRVLSPGGEKVFAAGRFSATRNGRPPDLDPRGAASLMSGLMDEFAQKLAQAIRSAPAQQAAEFPRDH